MFLKQKKFLALLSLDLFAVLFGGAVAMVPVYARDILKVGAEGFGFFNGASDLGAICSVILLTAFPLQKKTRYKSIVCRVWFWRLHYLFWLIKIIYAFIYSYLYQWHA